MHAPRAHRPARLAVLLVAAVLVGACSGGASPVPSPSPAVPTPVEPTPGADAAGFVIHASWTQALPPRVMFGNIPVMVVTADGRVITQGPVIEIYPGPLVAPLVERPITAKGIEALVQQAKDLGILRPDGDFTGGALMPGAAAAHVRIVVDGVTYELTGDAMAATPCPPSEQCPAPVPGTPAAFATFWTRLLDMASWQPDQLGPETAHVPTSYAVIVGPPPEPVAGIAPLVWPAGEPTLDGFGAPVRGEAGTRCGIADGALAASLRPLFDQATVLTPFVATATASATHGLTVRPLLPGDDDPCAPIVD